MWKAIRANRRRSVVLVMFMIVVVLALGCACGYVWWFYGYAHGYTHNTALAPTAALVGLACGALLLLIFIPVAVFSGASVLLRSADADEIAFADSPILFNVVDEMTIAAGLPKRPKVYIMDCDAPNAFSVGTPQASAICVTTGLLMRLNRDELQGVIAHEIGHIRNEDTRFLTLAGVLLGTATIITDTFRRGMNCCSDRRRSDSSGGGGGNQLLGLLAIAAVLFIVFAPLLMRLLYFACSRRREYLADASAASFTRYPAGLASALEKIEQSSSGMADANGALAPMFIVNPLAAAGGTGLFSTHPPTAERIRILRSMAGGAGLADYEHAFAAQGSGALLDAASLAAAPAVGIRAPNPSLEEAELSRARAAVDIIHRLRGAIFISCACGMKIKVPFGYGSATVSCPGCGRENPIPAALLPPAADAPKTPDRPATFHCTPGTWQSFRCVCGRTIQLSPTFHGQKVFCPKCKAAIEITQN